MKYPDAEHQVHKLELQAAFLNLEADVYDAKAREFQQLAAIARAQAANASDKIDKIWQEVD